MSTFSAIHNILDEACGLLRAGAILVTFGVSDAAVMDILTGKAIEAIKDKRK